MKKFIALVFCLFMVVLCLLGCKPDIRNRPTDFPGSRWVSESPPAEFIIGDRKVQQLSLTLNGTTNIYAINVKDEYGHVVQIFTWNPDPYYRYEFKDLLTVGNGTFKSDKFTFKITNDLSGLLEGYDKIVFYRDFEYENKK